MKEKYYSIKCLDTNCNQVAAYSGDKNGKYTVTLLKNNGSKIASYSDKYDAKAKNVKEPFSVGNSFFLSLKKGVEKEDIISYSINNKNGKELFSTENSIKLLTDDLVIMYSDSKENSGYTILDSKGNKKFSKISDYDIYANDSIITIEINGEKEILDSKGNIVLTSYSVVKDVKDDNGKSLYLIVKDSKNNAYNYFSINKNKIVGDSFQNYTKNSDGTLTVNKNINNEVVNYSVDVNGKQKKIGVNKTQSQIVNDIKKKIDTKKYNIYSTTITDESQNYIFADEKESKSFGIYDLKNNAFEKIYSYKSDSSNSYSTIYPIEGVNNNYYQVTCSSYSCDNSIFIIYDLNNKKSLYELNDGNAIIQNYYQYSNDYKVIRYSSSASNGELKGKFVLLDKDNKELLTSSNFITIVDSDLLIGKSLSSSLMLYSVNSNKVLNKDTNLASKIVIDEKDYYKYTDSENSKIIIINNKGKEVVNISSSLDLIYSDKMIAYIDNNKVNMLIGDSGKTKTYKLKENEKMNDASGALVPPYRGVLFINNSSSNYIKIVNQNGSVIRKIAGAEIQNVNLNKDNNVIIITRDDSGKTPLYGLYIAK